MQMKRQKTSRLPSEEVARWGRGDEVGWAWDSAHCSMVEARREEPAWREEAAREGRSGSNPPFCRLP